jgi:hypothetical protein
MRLMESCLWKKPANDLLSGKTPCRRAGAQNKTDAFRTRWTGADGGESAFRFTGWKSTIQSQVISALGGKKMRKVAVAFLGAAAGTLLLPGETFAQDATWTGAVSGDWQTDANWSPAAQPTDTAIFGNSGQTTITFSNNDVFHPVSVGAIQLNAGAPVYTFRPSYLSLTGAGIV